MFSLEWYYITNRTKDTTITNYITENRALLEAIHLSCKENDIVCNFFSDDWVIKLQKNGQTRFIFGYIFDCNSHVSGTIATDKVATYQLLANNDIASVPHYLLSTVINPMINTSMLEKLFKQHKSLVVKPLQGSRGNLVAKFGDRAGALKFIKNSQEISWVASPYIDIKRELRLVIFNGSIWLAYEKLDPKIIGNLKMFNVNLGAHVRNLEIGKLDRKIKVLAKRSMDAIGLKLGAVDIILDDKENAYVLEINSGFSLEHYAQISPANRHNVLEFYKAVISSLFVT